jgi:hypothetical protein
LATGCISVKLTFPKYYDDDAVIVKAIYRGGPAVKVVKARARVVRIEGIRWFEKAPGQGVDAVLKPENREVVVKLDSEYAERFWYIDVMADGGRTKRCYLRLVPRFWLKPVEISLITQDRVGGIATPGQFEKSVKAIMKSSKKQKNSAKK